MMPVCDLLITKPSELACFPIPKIFMRHIGGHEVYDAISGREPGDSLSEYPTAKALNAMLDKALHDKEILSHMCDRITELKEQGCYNGVRPPGHRQVRNVKRTACRIASCAGPYSLL